MTEEKKEALAAIEARKGLVCDVADHIWEYAELSLQEFKSAALYCEVLEKEGFRVKKRYQRHRNGIFRKLWKRPSCDWSSGRV